MIISDKEKKKCKILSRLIIDHIRPLLVKYKKPIDYFPPDIVADVAFRIYECKATYKSAASSLELMLWIATGQFKVDWAMQK